VLGGQASRSELIDVAELSQVSVTALKGVGEAMAEKLAKVGLENLQDVLFHLPLRYQDRTRVVPIGALRPPLSKAWSAAPTWSWASAAACWCASTTAPAA
jgi:hypothetical protein